MNNSFVSPSRADVRAALLKTDTAAKDLEMISDLGDEIPRIPAAVLVALVSRGEGLSFLLTTRNLDLRHHAGQVSFPGGRLESHDVGPVAAALRESEEEIGLSPQSVEVAGRLHLYHTVSGFMVSPIVGFVSPNYSLTLDPAEVSDAFELPFSCVLEPGRFKRDHGVWQGQRRSWYTLEYENRVVWGVTAGIIVHLLERMGLHPVIAGVAERD